MSIAAAAATRLISPSTETQPAPGDAWRKFSRALKSSSSIRTPDRNQPRSHSTCASGSRSSTVLEMPFCTNQPIAAGRPSATVAAVINTRTRISFFMPNTLPVLKP